MSSCMSSSGAGTQMNIFMQGYANMYTDEHVHVNYMISIVYIINVQTTAAPPSYTNPRCIQYQWSVQVWL